jgi:hypothetical protein
MENTLNKKELDDVFIDVRKSYRLLYSYQRRMMDLVQFIGTHYGFQYVQGWSEFSSAREPKKLKLNNSAWDMLGMYCFTFQFSTKDFGKYKNIELLVVLVNDTGFYDISKNRKDRVHIDKFSDVNDAKTQLHLCLKTTNQDWSFYHHEMFKANSKKEYTEKTDISDLLIGKKYDLSDFMNEENTLMQLKNFEDFCIKNGIILRPKKTD